MEHLLVAAHYAPRIGLAVMAVLLIVVLFGFQQGGACGVAWAAPGPWAERWAFSPLSLGRFSLWRLALVSALGMFLELLMIRWISSEIRIFAYFKNFVLIACFLGFGLGCYLCRRRINLLALIVPLLALALVVTLPWYDLRELIARLPAQLGAISEVHVWGGPSLPLNRASLVSLATPGAVVGPPFALLAFLVIPTGQRVWGCLENATRRIAGY